MARHSNESVDLEIRISSDSVAWYRPILLYQVLLLRDAVLPDLTRQRPLYGRIGNHPSSRLRSVYALMSLSEM